MTNIARNEIETLASEYEQFAKTPGLSTDRIRKTAAALRQLLNPWRGIESAPKDGTEIIVYVPATGKFKAFAVSASYHPDAGFCVDPLRETTHWMPFPEFLEGGENR